MLQQMQIYSNNIWLLSSTEKDSLTAGRLVHRTCFFDIYNQYTWEAGYMHSYNAILSLDNLLTADSQDTIYAGLSQALDYTGLSSHSSRTCGSDHKISTTAVKLLEEMRGHNDHAHALPVSTWRRSTITGRAFTKQAQSRRTWRRTRRERESLHQPILAHRILGSTSCRHQAT